MPMQTTNSGIGGGRGSLVRRSHRMVRGRQKLGQPAGGMNLGTGSNRYRGLVRPSTTGVQQRQQSVGYGGSTVSPASPASQMGGMLGGLNAYGGMIAGPSAQLGMPAGGMGAMTGMGMFGSLGGDYGDPRYRPRISGTMGF